MRGYPSRFQYARGGPGAEGRRELAMNIPRQKVELPLAFM